MVFSVGPYRPKVRKTKKHVPALNERDLTSDFDKSIESINEPLVSTVTQSLNDSIERIKLEERSEVEFVPETESVSVSAVENDGENPHILFQEYFQIIERKNDDKKNIVAKCKICEIPTSVRGSLNATSNYIRHLKVVSLYKQTIFEKKKHSDSMQMVLQLF